MKQYVHNITTVKPIVFDYYINIDPFHEFYFQVNDV